MNRLPSEASQAHNNGMSRWSSSRSCVALLVLIFSGLICAQQGVSPARQPAGQISSNQPSPELRVTTRMVVVDVIATDNKGVAVPDLKADDFTIQEEGQEQPVRALDRKSVV